MTIQPGVYLNMPEKQYFAVDAIGSSDIKKLLRAPADWWYSSRHNPDRVEPDRSPALIRGSALHALLLEGEAEYLNRYSIEPDPAKHPNAARTVDDIKKLLTKHKVDFKGLKTKAEFIDAAGKSGLSNLIWDRIIAHHHFAVEQGKKQPLTTADDRALRHMTSVVENHREIGSALRAGVAEVSVFWYRAGESDILYRARLDCLTPKYTLDLKTLSNWRGRSISDMPRRQIEELEYDIQRVFYDEARQQFRRHWLNGEIHSHRKLKDEPLDLLDEIAATEEWVWVWLFYQFRDDRTGKAPVVMPRFHRPEGQVWDDAEDKIKLGISNYRQFRTSFGLDIPWHHIEPTEEIVDTDLAGLQYKRVTT